MAYLLDAIYLFSLVCLSPWLLFKVLTTQKYRRNLRAKLFGSNGPSPPVASIVPSQGTVWFHGVSVGEIHLLRSVVAGFRKRHPDWEYVVSSSTDTGLEEARKRFPDLQVICWPLDFSWAVRRTLHHVRPDLVVLAEGDLWPNFLRAARLQDARIAVINGRMSPHSFRRFQRLAWWCRSLFAAVDLFAVQTEEYASNYRSLGVPDERIAVTGSVKFDGVEARRDNPRTGDLRRLLGLGPNELVWIAGSTQTPEEELALAIYKKARATHPNLRLVLVPRQRERFDEVAKLVQQASLDLIRRSQIAGPLDKSQAVIVVDTIGELGALWGLAEVAFVGGSLDGRRGGQNMIEPAAYGAAVVFGPHVWNFRETATRLVQAGGAVQVTDGDVLEGAILRLLGDRAERERMGTAGAAFVQQQQGATQRTLDLLDRLIQPPTANQRAA